MKITVIGTGYVGLVTGACLSDVGIEVTCVDIDQKKIDGLKNGILPIYEPGLKEIVERNYAKGRLNFSTDLSEAIQGSAAAFIAVGTPPGEDGSADLKYVLAVADQIGKTMTDYLVVITKSTVPVGTAEKVRGAVANALDLRDVDFGFDVASNPEFLKEGAAIDDFMKPDRIVVGVDSDDAQKIMDKLYRPFTLNGHPVIFMDIPSAEMTKYAANAMLATKISFMNDIANLCEKMGADVNWVRKGIGSDPRIGNKFIYPGIGYGGSCFPKDVKALARTGRENGHTMRILEAVEAVNDDQKSVLFNKINAYFGGDLQGKTIAFWGLSFQAEYGRHARGAVHRIGEPSAQSGCERSRLRPGRYGGSQARFGRYHHLLRERYGCGSGRRCFGTDHRMDRVPRTQLGESGRCHEDQGGL